MNGTTARTYTFADLNDANETLTRLVLDHADWALGDKKASTAEETAYQTSCSADRVAQARVRVAAVSPAETPALDIARRLDAVGIEVQWTKTEGLLDTYEIVSAFPGYGIGWTYSPVPLIDGTPYGLDALLGVFSNQVEIERVDGEPTEEDLRRVLRSILREAAKRGALNEPDTATNDH